MNETGRRGHERRYGSSAERLRAPARVALLKVPRDLNLCVEGIAAARVLDVGTGTGIFAEAFGGRGLDVTGIYRNPGLLAVGTAASGTLRLQKYSFSRPPSDGRAPWIETLLFSQNVDLTL